MKWYLSNGKNYKEVFQVKLRKSQLMKTKRI
jgi:hypothetical protein